MSKRRGHGIERLQPIDTLRVLRSFDTGRTWLRPGEVFFVTTDWNHGLIVARSRDFREMGIHVSWEQIRTYCELLTSKGLAIDPRPFEERGEAALSTPSYGLGYMQQRGAS
jgi:hypothetical protein